MEDKQLNDLSYRIIGAGVEVHRALGPGLLESTYRTCMAYELRERQMKLITEQLIPLRYKTLDLDRNYRIDLIVEDTIIVELKSVETVLPVHRAQVCFLRGPRSGHVDGLKCNCSVPLRLCVR